MKQISLIIALVFAVLLPSFASAGSEQKTNPSLTAAEISQFTDKVQRTLAARGANVAIVGRVGRDPRTLPAGIKYTHVAYWVYSQMTRTDGSTYTGYRVYNLYQQADNPRVSRLIQDSPNDFFAGAYTLDAGIIIPDIRLQRKLLKVISSPDYANLHNASYSVLANPRTTQFQNCTEHTLDVLMASLYGTSSKAQIKANINAYFEPQHIKLTGAKRLFAPAASPALTTADHGKTVQTATFGSIARFMRANDLDAGIYRHLRNGTGRYPI